MKCFNCGCTLSEDDFCTACGADVKTYKRIIRLSNKYYNDGLDKARVRDLSGAAASLELSLKCNKNNVQARNLLGLVYFETGEIVPALSEWIISKNIRPKKNIADDFINEIQNNQARLNGHDALIRKYNQALSYAQHDDLDLAVIQLKAVVAKNPGFLKAIELLCLIYVNNEEWNKARKVAEKGLKTDAGNTRLQTYLKETLKRIREKENASGRKSRKQRDEVISYTSGNETIIQPLNDTKGAGGQTIINILIGLLIGAALMWFLILPARIQIARNEINDQLKEVSEELTSKTADMDDLNKRIEALQEENKEFEDRVAQYTGKDGVMEDYNDLLSAALSYINDPEDALTAAESLEKIEDPEGADLSPEFKALYEYLNSNVSAKAAELFLTKGIDKYNDGSYEGAIEDLKEAFTLNPESDQALYYLAQSYVKSDDQDKATELFNQLISSFPDSEFKGRAERYVRQGEEDNEAAELNTGDTIPGAADNAAEQAAIQAALAAAAQAQSAAAAQAAQQAAPDAAAVPAQ